VAGLLDADYSASQMSYDLRRLRLHRLIEKIPGTNTYRTTSEGIRAAVFYTKVRDRLLGPLLDAGYQHRHAGYQPPAPVELRRALTTIDRALTDYIAGDHPRELTVTPGSVESHVAWRKRSAGVGGARCVREKEHRGHGESTADSPLGHAQALDCGRCRLFGLSWHECGRTPTRSRLMLLARGGDGGRSVRTTA